MAGRVVGRPQDFAHWSPALQVYLSRKFHSEIIELWVRAELS
jgi:hypothetical protein